MIDNSALLSMVVQMLNILQIHVCTDTFVAECMAELNLVTAELGQGNS